MGPLLLPEEHHSVNDVSHRYRVQDQSSHDPGLGSPDPVGAMASKSDLKSTDGRTKKEPNSCLHHSKILSLAQWEKPTFLEWNKSQQNPSKQEECPPPPAWYADTLIVPVLQTLRQEDAAFRVTWTLWQSHPKKLRPRGGSQWSVLPQYALGSVPKPGMVAPTVIRAWRR